MPGYGLGLALNPAAVRNWRGEEAPLEPDKALAMTMTGQSLYTSRLVNELDTYGTKSKQPTGGGAVSEQAWFATNNEHTAKGTDFNGAVAINEGVGQSPIVGVAIGIEETDYFTNAYLSSVAVGARAIGTLQGAGPRANLAAAIRWSVQSAAADGYAGDDIEAAIPDAQGEADSTAATPAATFEARKILFYKMCRLYYRGCLKEAGRTDWATYEPLFLIPSMLQHKETAVNTGENDRTVRKSYVTIAAAFPNVIEHAVYQYPAETDRVHHTAKSTILKGEALGHLINDFFAGTETGDFPRILSVTTDAARTSSSVVFSAAVAEDTTLLVGSNLNTAAAEDGFEWFDNGVARNITAVSGYGTNTLTLTHQALTGTAGQQVLRYAEQYTSNTLTAGHTNLAGGQAMEDEPGFVSAHDATYTHRRFALPQVVTGVTFA